MGDAHAELLAKEVLELALAEAGEGGEAFVAEGLGEVGLDMALHPCDARIDTARRKARPLLPGQQLEPDLFHTIDVAALADQLAQEGEIVTLGFVQLDKGALTQAARQPWALLHQEGERRIGGVVVALTGGYDTGETGEEALTLSLHLYLDGAVQGDHQLGEVVVVAADVALIATQAERGRGCRRRGR
ncbi:hypothetical protein D3C79_838410 [compost metagenome]